MIFNAKRNKSNVSCSRRDGRGATAAGFSATAWNGLRGDSRSQTFIRGTSIRRFAGFVGKYWIERWARLPVKIDVASEYRYREAPIDDGGLTTVVSQSGETADTLASLRYVKDGRRDQFADQGRFGRVIDRAARLA